MIAPKSFSDSRRDSVVVDQLPDARVALTEEEVADDRADHRQTRGDAEAREDRGHARGQLEPPQPREAARVVQREEVVLPLVGR